MLNCHVIFHVSTFYLYLLILHFHFLRPPYRELEGITHFFAELDKAPENLNLEAFAAKGIPCLKPIYINNYLIMDPLPEEEDHYISQYRDLLVSMR